MKSKRMLATLLASTLVLSVAFTGCGKTETKTATKQEVNFRQEAVKTMDSSRASDQASFDVVQNVQETLYVSKNDKPVPGAAEKYDISADKKTYTFHIRDMKWSDGKKLTAKDFEYAWKRVLTPETKANYGFFLFPVKNAEKFYKGEAKAEEVGITAVDDKTLKVELENPTAYFLQLITFPVLSPLRQDVVEKSGDKYGSDPSKMVYSGPFTVTTWQRGAKIVLKKNPNYYNVKNTKLDTVNYKIIKEMSTAYQMFSNKQLDTMYGTGEYLDKLRKDAKDDKISMTHEPSPSAFYMMYNQTGKVKLLTNAKIRRALGIAVDNKTYVDKLYKRGYVAEGLVPEGIMAGDKEYRKEVKEPFVAVKNEDPKALFIEGLKELGLDPDPSKYTLKYLAQASDADTRKNSEFFQQTWQKKIGCKIELQAPASFADYLKKAETQQFEIAMSGWGADYNDPLTFMALFKSGDGNNNGKYNNPKYDELIKKIELETDKDKRIELIKEAEELLVVKDAGITPLFYKDKLGFRQKYIKGLQYPSFGGTYQLRWAYVEK
jgi:oligopeptide transport system substrate-binding protein